MRNGNGVGQRQVGQLLLCIPQACCVFWLSLCTYNGILRIVLVLCPWGIEFLHQLSEKKIACCQPETP